MSFITLYLAVRRYLEQRYAPEPPKAAGSARKANQLHAAPLMREEVCESIQMDASIDPALRDRLEHLDEGFSRTVLRLIDERGWTDPECYKRANLDKKVFSKLRGDADYRPSKPTAAALALALELDADEGRALLAKAGYALSPASKFDLIVEYCLLHGVYDVFAVNELLYAFDQPLLGSKMS